MKDAIKGGFKSKTIWFGTAVTILGIVQSTIPTLALTPTQTGLVGMAIGIVVVILRAITSDSLSEKGSPDEPDAESMNKDSTEVAK
jgi:hypothetical protein